MEISEGLSPISADDRAGLLWIFSILGIVYTGSAALVRGRIKSSVFGSEDYLISFATFVYFAQCAAIFYGLQNGLARSDLITPQHQKYESGKAFLVSEILCVVALCLSKCSTFALITRVLRPVRVGVDLGWIMCISSLMLSIIWGIGSVVGLAMFCDPSTIMSDPENTGCPGHYRRWVPITILDMFTDFMACLVPVLLVYPLKMHLGDRAQVLVAFAFRLAAIPASATHLAYVAQLSGTTDLQLESTMVLVLQQTMLVCSLLTSHIPNLKSLITSFSMGMGVKLFESENATQSSHQWYALQTIGGSFAVYENSRHVGPFKPGVERRNSNDHPVSRREQAQHERAVRSNTADSETGVGCVGTGRTGSEELIVSKDMD